MDVNDEPLDTLAQMDLISHYDSSFQPHFNYSYKNVPALWTSKITKNNEDTEKRLEHYFSKLMKVVKVQDSVFLP